MAELVFLKLGGSLITDKNRESTAREEVVRRLAQEVRQALDARPDLRLVLGHGSGSFGHFVGRRYGTRQGIRDETSWRGYAETGAAAARLNRIVTDVFLAADVPVLSVQPSASARCRNGELLSLDVRPVSVALANGLLPLVYGDVALDEVRGCTIISTEQIFARLANRLQPQRIILGGIVDGVFDRDPLRDPAARPIAEITPATFPAVERQLAGSHGVDVTGGMLSKVREMLAVVERHPELEVQLISGQEPGRVARALLCQEPKSGTVLHAGCR
ncbi:MAG: isopentenyl phosphate kinase [Chloroflexota bacterium]|nr:isopentenyl phosphate kinase [Chloroflexota bacterium]